jgi:hypothetical protein
LHLYPAALGESHWGGLIRLHRRSSGPSKELRESSQQNQPGV